MVDSPFRTQTIQCPRCQTTELSKGELRHCVTCKGAWIPTETLAEHVGAMQSRIDPTLMWQIDTTRLGLPCAVCKHTMETARLFGVPVDHCHSHGVWFDRDELAEVLRRSSYVGTHKSGDGVDPWLVADVAEVGAYAAVESAAAVSELAVESPGILEGVLDAIGGIFSAIDL